MATPSSNLSVQNFFETTLSSSINATDTTIPLNSVPTGTEGFLVIEPDNATSREIIFFNSKTVSSVVCPSAAEGRGQDGTSATSHASGATVRMTVTAGYWSALQDGTGLDIQAVAGQPFGTGWVSSALPAVSSVTYNGNRSADVVFASTVASLLSPGMRIRTTRTVTAPTQCTDLEASSSQYFSSASAGLAGMTFTDDFTCSAWVKLESYASMNIASRYNGTSGWEFAINSSGQVYLQGRNAGAANISYVLSYQSLPLNKWVHVTAQLDMSTFTATTTTSYIMIDGVDVPASVARGGTNPTALVQAGDLQIGAANTTAFFDGKLAQVAIFSAKVTQATMRGYISQGLSGSETNLVSAYSCNNSLLDLNTTNNNDLTANGGALMTNADSPFGQDGSGVPSGTTDYALVTKVSTTTATVQLPEGCTIPTSGGVSAVAYSTTANPFGWVADKGRWSVESLIRTQLQAGAFATGTTVNHISTSAACLTVPVGSFAQVGYEGSIQFNISVAGSLFAIYAMSETTASIADTTRAIRPSSASTTEASAIVRREAPYTATAQTPFYFNVNNQTGVNLTSYIQGGGAQMRFFAIPSGI